MNLQRLFRLGVLVVLLLPQGMVLAEMVSIAKEDINMRSGPDTKHEVLWKIGSGFPVEIIKKSGEWLEVKDFEGSTGWVQKEMTQKTGHMIVKANKDGKKQIEVYSEPSTKSKVVARANYGVVFKTLEKKSGWIKVEHGKEVTGWVESNLLWGF